MYLKKIYALFFSIVMLLTMVLCACGVEQVAVPYSSDDCIGKNQASIQRDFSEVGFTNIQYKIVDDLEISEASKDEQVVSVEIDGASEFNAGAKFNVDASVVITYHTIKNIAVPFSSDDVEDTEIEEIIKSLEDVGFVEFAVEEIFDLDPDDTDGEFENRVFIGGNSSFYSGDEFPMNSEVKIVTHRPYEKYTLKLSIDFVENWIFSTYDVEMEFDGHYEDLAHGKDGNFEYRVKPGKYTLTFSSEEDSDTKGTVELDIKGDTTASYKINCHSGYIDVTTLSVEDKGAVGDNEAMAPYSASDCKYENYKDIEKAFKNAGFTNISTEILYDIVWGWTDEGEVDKVSINGNTKFIKGDVFSKDTPIVITYHMKEEDDPKNKQTQPETNKTETQNVNVYTVDNCIDLADLIMMDRGSNEDLIKSFAYEYEGKTIELEMLTSYVVNHGSYETRYDFLLYAIKDENVMLTGPAFFFEDINYYELNLIGDNIPDSIGVGVHCKVVAEVDGYEDGMIYLDPESVEVIKVY